MANENIQKVKAKLAPIIKRILWIAILLFCIGKGLFFLLMLAITIYILIKYRTQLWEQMNNMGLGWAALLQEKFGNKKQKK